MSKGVPANAATCTTCPSDRNRSAIPRWSRTSMVRECRPPAREPGRSWLERRSTMATSTPANANSPANISPVGPPPATTTAFSAIRHPHPRRFWFRPEILQHAPGLAVAIPLERSIAPPQVDDVDRHAPDATATGRRSGARPLRRYPTLSVHERELVRVDVVHDLAASGRRLDVRIPEVKS